MKSVKQTVQTVLETIRKHGGEAYLVGGCVRDLILGREPNDYDIATNLMPQDIMKIFNKVIPTGINHLTVTILLNGYSFEITTYRAEADYSDGRHPDEVFAADTVEEDLSRRDFTMNALASKDVEVKEIINCFSGKKDIENKIIRCVGTVKERFDEDKLRAIRAVRFAAQLNFKIDEEVFNELKNVSLDQISRERIRVEIIKILSSNKPVYAFELLYDSGLLEQFIPELCVMKGMGGGKYHKEDVWTHTMNALKESVQHTGDWKLRLAVLLHDIGKPVTLTKENGVIHFYMHEKVGSELASQIMKRLKFSNHDITYVKRMVRWHMATYNKTIHGKLSKKQIKKVVRNVKEQHLWDMMILNYCDDKANSKNHTISFDAYLEKKTIWFQWQEIKKLDSALKVTDLAVDGHDMLKIGYREVQVGAILRDMLDKVDSDKLVNDRESLMSYAKNKMLLAVKMESNSKYTLSQTKLNIPNQVEKFHKMREEYKRL